MKSRRLGWLAIIAITLCASQSGLAAPLDLFDLTPRWVEVRFEISPPDAPGQLNQNWGVVRSAYLEADASGTRIRIRIPADEIESHLRATGIDAIPGSFSDFVWTLNPKSGHVLEASFSGRIREQLSFGIFKTSALVEIEVLMNTQNPAGYRPSKGLLGLETHFYCIPHPKRSGRNCIPVRATRFDPASGYVNAVGSIRAATPLARVRAFSPLGEAQFSEHGDPELKTAISRRSASKAVCFPLNDRPCEANLGGES